MNTTLVALVLLGTGLLSGFRTFTPLALVSWLAVWGWTPLAGSPFWFVGTEPFAIPVTILAVLELIGDKLPKTPARTHLMPVGRVVAGGLTGGALGFAAGWIWIGGVLLGGSAAVVGAFVGYHLRRIGARTLHLPDLIVGLIEDFITIAGTLFLVRDFFHTAV